MTWRRSVRLPGHPARRSGRRLGGEEVAHDRSPCHADRRRPGRVGQAVRRLQPPLAVGPVPIRPVKDFLNGTWLGHPVLSALTDVPIGALTVALVLDIVGQRVAADVALLVAVLSIIAAAVTGLADYTDADGTARMRATVHAVLPPGERSRRSRSGDVRAAGVRGPRRGIRQRMGGAPRPALTYDLHPGADWGLSAHRLGEPL